MNRLATFHKVVSGRGEHDGEKSLRIGSLICPALRARSYAKMGVAQEGRKDFWLMANWGSIIPLVRVEPRALSIMRADAMRGIMRKETKIIVIHTLTALEDKRVKVKILYNG